MTVHSGFPTRKLEQRYNGLVVQIIQLLSQLIITYVERSKIQPFEKQFQKIYSSMQKMDALKHMDPKFSLILKPLSEHIFLIDQPISIVSDVQGVHSNSNHERRRPMTSNNFTQERRHSIEFERKTINVFDQQKQLIDRYGQKGKTKNRYHSFSVKHSSNGTSNQNILYPKPEKHIELEIPQNITMEELMEKNRLVERKLTLFRKKRQLQPAKFGKIPELDEEEDPPNF